MVRMVFGLGTRAVNRVGGDYPRMIALSHPLLRPEAGQAISKYSQREVDLLDLTANQEKTCYFSDVLEQASVPSLHLLVSELRDRSLYDPVGRRIDTPKTQLVLTFNRLLKETPLVPVLRDMLAKLERGYGQPVDTEFTASLDEHGALRVNLLQCRPLRVPGLVGPVVVPENISNEHVLFRAQRTISGGVVKNIRWALCIDPVTYAAMTDPALKRALGRVVGRVNARLGGSEERMLMLGPGRWGSSNIDLGVNVSYADITNTAVLVELAREEAGHVPELSYGTHFFQDLVEAQIIYLPVYPDDPKAQFNQALFREGPNELPRLLPEFAEFAPWVRVIDFEAVQRGSRATLVADPQSQVALCYLEG
jgi:pyruvate, water dikinase